METEESNGAGEFQEKTGLKRKLTGPPRLLLGKSRSPGQVERKSRKQRRHNDANDAPMDAAKDEQSDLTSPESPESVPATELDGGMCMDLQDAGLETTSNLERSLKKRRRRSKAGETIRRIFSCVRRRKELGMKAVKDAEENSVHQGPQDEELLSHSTPDPLKMKHGEEPVKRIRARTFKVRMWHIFKKHSSKAKQELKEQGHDDRFREMSSERSVDQRVSGTAEPAAVDRQQNESSGIDEDVTSLESQDSKNEVMEMISLNVEVNVDANAVFIHENHQDPPGSHFLCLVGDEDTQINGAPLSRLEEPEDPRTYPGDVVADHMVVDVPAGNEDVFRFKPVITIEDVHSSEEENDELFESAAPRYGTLSPLVSLNGSCYTLKTSQTRFSEILLTQTALSLVRAAISGAVEQLSAETQSRQMDQDQV